MTQIELHYPTARRHDPATSHLAGYEHTRSGQRAAHAERVLCMVRTHPGSSYRELAGTLPDMEPVEVMRRLNDLAHAGLVSRGTQRTCRVSGRAAITWEAA